VLFVLYGCLKAGLTVVPIFAGFGAGAIATRIQDSGAGVVFTVVVRVRCLSRRLRRRSLAAVRAGVVVAAGDGRAGQTGYAVDA